MFNTREQQVIREIIGAHTLSTDALAQTLKLTKRQLNYSVSKINEELQSHKQLTITRTQNGQWYLDNQTKKWLTAQLNQTIESDLTLSHGAEDVLSPSIRQQVLLIYLLCFPKVIRVLELQEFAYVSRNTILSDLKQLEAIVGDENCEIRYTPRCGYTVQGEDNCKRTLLIRLVNLLVRRNANLRYLDELIVERKEQAIELIYKTENQLKLKYSDSSFTFLLYSIACSSLYIQKNENKQPIKRQALSVTKELTFLSEAIGKIGLAVENDSDIEWYSLLFLSSNTIKNTVTERDEELFQAISEMILVFETKSYIRIANSDALARRLFAHLRPTIYRIQFNLPIDDINLDTITSEKLEYQTIFDVLKESIYPIEKIIGKRLPIDEIKLISFYFGGELFHQTSDYTHEKKRAIVVCSNGLIVAKLMLKSLTELFPEIHFVAAASAREFKEYGSSFDIIFTTIPLGTSNRLEYLVKPLMNEKEQLRLRIKVLQDLALEDVLSETDELIRVIRQHTNGMDEKNLRTALGNYFANQSATIWDARQQKRERPRPTLSDYLNPGHIILSDKDYTNWPEAIYEVCNPLKADGIITQQYVDKLLSQLRDPDTYFFLNETIAIPHANPEDGVLEEGCNLLISQKPIYFHGTHCVHFIVPFALQHTDRHLLAVSQLLTLAENQTMQQKLLAVKTAAEAFSLIENI